MAKEDGKVVIGTGLDNKGIEKDVGKLGSTIKGALGGLAKVVAGVAVSIVAAFGTAAVAITKQAVEAYADYEQLAGGVETLFKDAADKVVANAENAFYTVGISANEYMQTVTSFSASLISSLGGDTAKAADVADMALTDMADNANKMGSTLESVQNAYQGFAKGQYQLLDNLKLGYGGTKTEMERLLVDAQKLTGVKYNINNLADVYNAIHAIQGEMGISARTAEDVAEIYKNTGREVSETIGTTAKEAEKTITGSANMTKAAWNNVLAAIAGGGDLDRAVNNLVFSLSKLFDNLVPVVERSLAGIGELIEKIAPQLIETIAVALIKAIPSLVSAVYKMVIGLVSGIYRGIVALFSGSTKEIAAQLNATEDLADNLNGAADGASNLAEATEEAGKAAKKSLAPFDEIAKLGGADSDTAAESATGGIASGGAASGSVEDTAIGNNADAAFSLISILEILKEKLQEIASWLGLDSLAFSAGTIFGAFWDALEINQTAVEEAISDLLDSFSTMGITVGTIFSDMWSGVIQGTEDWVTENESLIRDAFGGVISLTTSFGNLLSGIVGGLFGTLLEWWNSDGVKIWDGIVECVGDVMEWVTRLWNDVLQPVVENLINEATSLWHDHLEPLWTNVLDFITSVWDAVKLLWDKKLKPMVDWLITNLGPPIKNIINSIVQWVKDFIGVIVDVVSGIIKSLSGVLDFITGVFTGDWEKAWEGIKKFFGGIWDAIWGIIKGVINCCVDGLNMLWSGLYGALRAIVNGVGSFFGAIGTALGQNWGWEIPADPPMIPRLAKGAVLPPNKPFMAVVGDQTHGTNVEAPLATIQEAVAIVMEDMVRSNIAGHEATVAVLREILEAVLGIHIGDDVIGQAVARYNAKMAVIRGGT